MSDFHESWDRATKELLTTLRALESECRTDATDAMNHQYYQYFDGKAEGVAHAIEIVKAVLL